MFAKNRKQIATFIYCFIGVPYKNEGHPYDFCPTTSLRLFYTNNLYNHRVNLQADENFY